jgi:hypothetical protein
VRSISLLEDKVLKAQSEDEKNDYRQQLAGAFSYVGDFGKAVQIFSEAFPNTRPADISSEDILALRKALPLQNAVEALCTAARSQRVVIINEAHHHPEHRAFIQRVLPCLKNAGFKYAAFETIGEESAALNARGYVTRETGWYSQEPQMARLINSAMKFGFSAIRYESRKQCEGCSVEDSVDSREEQQAANLVEEIFAKDKQAKALIVVGFAHAYKYQLQGSPKSRWMAARLWEKTGIEPYTVEQLSEDFALNAWNPHYEPLMDVSNRTSMLVEVSKHWELVPQFFKPPLAKTETLRPAIDAVVLHPRQTAVATRWEWLETPQNEQTIVTIHPKISEAAKSGLVQAFPEDSFDKQNDIPLDQAMFEAGKPTQLVLPNGRYRLRIWNSVGEIVGEKSAFLNNSK